MMIWTDMETTGLDPHSFGAAPLEVAVILTDDDLNELRRAEVVLGANSMRLRQLGAVDDFVLEMHTVNGLWDECEASEVTHYQADTQLCEWFDSLGLDEKPPLAGSTISFDRAWLAKFFPNFHSRLHYRNIDVSTVKELVTRWSPDLARWRDANPPEGEKSHRAMDDILASIEEALIYKESLFDE